ncbi:serine/threonine-protein phosphatase 6 regulatory ankyrin repeat subunit C-like [Ruditapes philippinarum]|uniref:serine/threonine-protein phosphatase 6 regulatory ankyrin repeat subunit C-like n=1 Tax=Ruditapes philippinarum TaxID=129788 RepID=UPI00295B642E|nr:serine/threonine-protein phosphatase 6 regulatory ankyrin repeat subunit C-like [Ruditapes philippinarum]
MNDQSPLHHACDWNRVETVKLLLQKGADVNTKDTSGLSPFLVAAGWGRDEIMQMILAKRVDPLSVDEFEHNFLHICAANGRTGVMNAVMSRFPNEIKPILIARNKYGWTPLDFAIKCGHLGVTKLLVRTILQIDKQKPGHKAFVHTRFNIVKPEDLGQNEKFLQRFVDIDLEKVCFQIPRGKWYIEAGTQDDYDKVVHFVSKYEDRLKLRFAKN